MPLASVRGSASPGRPCSTSSFAGRASLCCLPLRLALSPVFPSSNADNSGLALPSFHAFLPRFALHASLWRLNGPSVAFGRVVSLCMTPPLIVRSCRALAAFLRVWFPSVRTHCGQGERLGAGSPLLFGCSLAVLPGLLWLHRGGPSVPALGSGNPLSGHSSSVRAIHPALASPVLRPVHSLRAVLPRHNTAIGGTLLSSFSLNP